MDGYLTVREIAEKWNMSIRNVQNLCSAGKIEGVTKFGQAWVIPETAEKPLDGRVTSGSYRNWRKKPKEQQVSGNQKIDTFLIPFLLKLTKMKQKDTGKIPQNKRFCNDKQPVTRMKSLSLNKKVNPYKACIYGLCRDFLDGAGYDLGTKFNYIHSMCC